MLRALSLDSKKVLIFDCLVLYILVFIILVEASQALR